jgi:hypothetical protein
MGFMDTLKHRLNPKTIATEISNHLIERTIPHGADELGNTLFSGSAYLPWPGKGGPGAVAAQETPDAPTIEPPPADPVGNGGAVTPSEPVAPVTPQNDGPTGYAAQIEQMRQRGGDDRSRGGMSR